MSDLKLEEVYFFLLERTVRQFTRFKKSKFVEKGIDITGDQWVVLKRIGEKDGITQREIAQDTSKDPASVTRILDILQKKGWSERHQVMGDRRAFGLSLTKEGKSVVKKITPLAKKLRAIGLEGVSDAELENLKKTLNKIYKNLS